MFRANIYGPLDGRMVILQLCHWKFHMKKLCSRLYLTEVDIIFLTEKSLFEPHMGNLEVKGSLEILWLTSYSS